MSFEQKMLADARRQDEIRQDLVARHPGLPLVTSIVMSGDLMTAEKWLSEARAGTVAPERAVWLTGSYARLAVAVRLVGEGLLSDHWLVANLPDVWRSSDPDDTEAEYLRLWRRAWIQNGHRVVLDGDPLPPGNPLRVYRGQRPEDEIGFSWTTDPRVADGFAHGASFRAPVQGAVIEGLVDPASVFTYLTGRDESEVIVNPRYVILEGQP